MAEEGMEMNTEKQLVDALRIIAAHEVAGPLTENDDNVSLSDLPFYVAGKARAELSILHNIARNALDKYEAAIAALPPQDWQDIASAPRDGTRVLLLCARSKPPEMIARWAQEWTTEEGDDAFEWVNDEDDAIYGTPTHWAALPARRALAGDAP
jgi:hypothetical protein